VINEISCVDMLNACSMGILVVDSGGVIRFVNRMALHILNLEHEAVQDLPLARVSPPMDRLAKECLTKGEIKQHPIDQEGEKLLVNLNPIDAGGKTSGVLCAFQGYDAFEKEASELESHKRLTRQLETIFNHSKDGLWLYSGDGVIINLNESAKSFLDAPAGNLVGKTYRDIENMGLLDRSVVGEVLKQKRQIDIISYTKDEKSDHAVTGTPLFDHSGNIDSIVVNVRDLTQLNFLKSQLEETKLETQKVKEELTALHLLESLKTEIIAESDAMKQVIQATVKMATFCVNNILILGESGTGKGLLANIIHNSGRDTKRPFVQINCAALPENLLEAELFGYEKGAFTGADTKGKPGLFEVANGGTLFLDEIGELPLNAQAKLLTYLDNQTITRIGGVTPKKVNCTIIAATNRDLAALVQAKKYRQDLLYRLNTFTIKIPPLRTRPEDVVALVNFFLNKYNMEFSQKRHISTRAMDLFLSHPLEGNVRELKSIIKNTVVMSEKDDLDDFLAHTLSPHRHAGTRMHEDDLGINERMMRFEREILVAAIKKCKTTRGMAQYLKTSQSAVMRRLKKHDIKVSQGRNPIGNL